MFPRSTSRAKVGADDRNRTGDLVLTKDALCQLSYIGEISRQRAVAIRQLRVWSGRRGSNPRPTAWKAVTLPLSYSRLRASRAPLFDATAGKPAAAPTLHSPWPPSQMARLRCPASDGPPEMACLRWLAIRSSRKGAKDGGEGRVRTSVAARAADLQSAAIDRSATSPFLLAEPLVPPPGRSACRGPFAPRRSATFVRREPDRFRCDSRALNGAGEGI
jgi:hypothetical protein